MKWSKLKILAGLAVVVITIFLYDYVMINKGGSDLDKTLTMCWFIFVMGVATSNKRYSMAIMAPNAFIKQITLFIIAVVFSVPVVLLTWYYFDSNLSNGLNQSIRLVWLALMWTTMWLRNKIVVIVGKVTK